MVADDAHSEFVESVSVVVQTEFVHLFESRDVQPVSVSSVEIGVVAADGRISLVLIVRVGSALGTAKQTTKSDGRLGTTD